MTIDEAYRLLNLIVNKDQRGYIKPSSFNLWAKISQIELMSDRLNNLKKLNERQIPQYGFKVNQKSFNELRPLVVGPQPLTFISGIADYPDDYFYLDSLKTSANIDITPIDSDEYARVKKSEIYPPDVDHPVLVFYGVTLAADPSNTSVIWTYVRYPIDPFWAYNEYSGLPVFTPSGSQNFEVDASAHTEIVWRMARYAGVNIDQAMVTQMAMAMEASGV